MKAATALRLQSPASWPALHLQLLRGLDVSPQPSIPPNPTLIHW